MRDGPGSGEGEAPGPGLHLSEGTLMCSCITAKCAGCTCGCFHTPATRRSFWQGFYAAVDALDKYVHGQISAADAIAAIDALSEKT